MKHGASSSIVALLPLLVIAAFILFGVLVMKRRGYFGEGADNVVVRCREGHLFTTIWIPFVSFKAVRLGTRRFQHCPIGNHWTIVIPVDPSSLTEAEMRFATDHHDHRIP